ncbi:MAG: hypothetical protein J6K95_04060 [Rikenellaceae bacterium]|nr:hypothetical protein [Rikenellaceae bacterium]
MGNKKKTYQKIAHYGKNEIVLWPQGVSAAIEAYERAVESSAAPALKIRERMNEARFCEEVEEYALATACYEEAISLCMTSETGSSPRFRHLALECGRRIECCEKQMGSLPGLFTAPTDRVRKFYQTRFPAPRRS